jgi:RND family efflux transporter MFP subunit
MHRRLTLPAALAGSLLLAACGTSEDAAPTPASAPAGATATVRDSTLAALIEASGTAEPVQQATLSTRLMASVADVHVREGDRVVAGQVLARLDTRDLDARAAQVAAGLAEATAMEREAEAMAHRIRALYRDSAATRVQLDQVETGLARAQAAVRTANAAAAELAAHRSYAEIAAPFAGVVVRRFVDPGAMAAPGAPLVMVEDATRLRVRATAAPDHVRGLARGSAVEVLVEGRSVRGEVEGVVRAPVGNMAQVNVIVSNRDGALVSGSAATVLLPHGTRAGLVVPAGAVIREGDLTGVDLVVAGAVERRWIRLGRTLEGGLMEVLSGLSAGDQVVLRGAAPGGA